jgi:hypothetical protein
MQCTLGHGAVRPCLGVALVAVDSLHIAPRCRMQHVCPRGSQAPGISTFSDSATGESHLEVPLSTVWQSRSLPMMHTHQRYKH